MESLYDVNKKLTIDEILKVNPYLKNVISFVKKENIRAKTEDIYWYQVWSKAKRMMMDEIGWMCDYDEISDSYHWCLFHDHLKDLSTYCK
jgi:hypothetical protein